MGLGGGGLGNDGMGGNAGEVGSANDGGSNSGSPGVGGMGGNGNDYYWGRPTNSMTRRTIIQTPAVAEYSPDGLIGGSARDTQAELYRQQFDDYVARFGDKEQELVDSYGNVSLRNAQIATAKNYSRQGFDNAEKAEEITRSRYGVSRNQQEQRDHDRRFNQARGLAEVDIANRTRQHMVDRDRQMLTTGMSGYSKRGQN